MNLLIAFLIIIQPIEPISNLRLLNNGCTLTEWTELSKTFLPACRIDDDQSYGYCISQMNEFCSQLGIKR